MNKRMVLVCAMGVVLVGSGRGTAGVGVSPPGFDPPAPIHVLASFGRATLDLHQGIIGPDKPVGIIAPERTFTTETHLQVCHPPDPGFPPGPCRMTNVLIKVSAADELTARAGGMLVAIGQLAGIIGPDVALILAKEGMSIRASVSSDGSVAGIIGPEHAADLLIASLLATVPRGECVVTHVGPPCMKLLPGLIRTGAAALGVGTTCGP